MLDAGDVVFGATVCPLVVSTWVGGAVESEVGEADGATFGAAVIGFASGRVGAMLGGLVGGAVGSFS